jgi:large subunit ribosomal protein L9
MATAKRKIILQQTVPQLGLVGEVVDVAPGYYRNHLAPRKLALLANPKSIKEVEHQRKIIEGKKQKEKAKAVELKTQVEAISINLIHAAGSGDKLFGSITAQEIARACIAKGFAIDRKMIQLANPLKNLGSHAVDVKLHPEVVASLKIEVTRKEEEKTEEEPKEKKIKKAKAKTEEEPAAEAKEAE